MATTTINVRVRTTDKELLKEICRNRGEDISDFVRRAIKMELARLSFLNDEGKKALGIREGL